MAGGVPAPLHWDVTAFSYTRERTMQPWLDLVSTVDGLLSLVAALTSLTATFVGHRAGRRTGRRGPTD